MELEWALSPMTDVLMRGENTQRHTQWGSTCEDGNRDWSDADTIARIPRISGNHQRLGDRHGRDTLSEPPERTHPLFW